MCSAATTSYPVLRLKPHDPPEMLCVVSYEYQSQRQGMGSHEGVERPDGHAASSQRGSDGAKTIRSGLIEGDNRYSLREGANQVVQLPRTPRLGAEA